MERNRFQLPGYQVLAQIHESDETVVYRAIRARGCRPVVLKMLKRPMHSNRPKSLSSRI
jgi:hypothetical protein